MRQKRQKKKLFDCARCNQAVYRATKKVNTKALLCGKCKGKHRLVRNDKGKSGIGRPRRPSNNPRSQATRQPANDFKTSLPTPQAMIAWYRGLLDKVGQLAKENPEKTFLDLWLEVRK